MEEKMYKAIEKIGGYEIGDEVPADKAETWLNMYDVPPVEKVDSEGNPLVPDEKDESSDNKGSNDPMLDDYLGRNANVVKKNIEEDNLSEVRLKALLELEKSDKKRDAIIKVIEKKLIN